MRVAITDGIMHTSDTINHVPPDSPYSQERHR
jgi:hypothetical protein